MKSISGYCIALAICMLLSMTPQLQPPLIGQIPEPFYGILQERWQGFKEGYSPSVLAISGRTAFIDDTSGIVIVDISNIDSPRVHSRLPLPLGQPRKLRIANDTLLLSISIAGLTILNVSNQTDPHILFDTALRDIGGVDVSGRQLYFNVNYQGTNQERYSVSYTYDISNWDVVAYVPFSEWAHFSTMSDVHVVGNFLFEAKHFADNIAYSISRINDSGAPQYLKEWFPPGYFVADLALRNSIVVFLFESGHPGDKRNLQTFHISNSGNLPLFQRINWIWAEEASRSLTPRFLFNRLNTL